MNISKDFAWELIQQAIAEANSAYSDQHEKPNRYRILYDALHRLFGEENPWEAREQEQRERELKELNKDSIEIK